VVCQSFTFCATANPIAYLRANPVFIDSESETWNMCPETLHDYLSYAKKLNRIPKAIIYVHTYGMPAKVFEILEVASEFDVPVIEDAAESIGSKIMNKPVGQYGALSIFSFNGNKIVTASGGGVLLSDSEKLIVRATYLATQARANDQFEHLEVGYNYRIGALNALFGSMQLDHLQQSVEARRVRFDRYKEALEDFANIQWQPDTEGNYSNRWLTAMLVNNLHDPMTIIDIFEQQNIEVKRLWKPLHLQNSFQGAKFIGRGTCVEFWKTGLCLPSGYLSSESDFDRIVSLLRETLRDG